MAQMQNIFTPWQTTPSNDICDDWCEDDASSQPSPLAASQVYEHHHSDDSAYGLQGQHGVPCELQDCMHSYPLRAGGFFGSSDPSAPKSLTVEPQKDTRPPEERVCYVDVTGIPKPIKVGADAPQHHVDKLTCMLVEYRVAFALDWENLSEPANLVAPRHHR